MRQAQTMVRCSQPFAENRGGYNWRIHRLPSSRPQVKRLRSVEVYIRGRSEIGSSNGARSGAVVPRPLAADEKARQTWLAVQAIRSPRTPESVRGARVVSCGALALHRQTAGRPSPGPRLVSRVRPRRRSSSALPSHASAAYAYARSRNIARKLAVAVDRVRALLLPAAGAPPD